MRNIILSLILIHVTAYAGLDDNQKQGLQDTQKMLKSPSERQKAIAKDPKAREMDAKVDALAGTSENKEEMYGLASQLLEKIALKANGDPAKMQEMMLKAQQDPKAFYEEYFDESQKARVRGVANKIDSKKPTAAGPR